MKKFIAVILVAIVAFGVFAGNVMAAPSETAKQLISILQKKSEGQARINVISETVIPGTDFKFILLDFAIGQESKEISFVTNGRYITNALVDLETGQNVALYYETTARKVSVETSPDELYFGNPNGKAKVVIFSDYNCSFCVKLMTELQPFFKQHEKNIAIYYKHLPYQPNSRQLSVFYEAGKKLGYTWNMYAENYGGMNSESLTKLFEQKLNPKDVPAFRKLINDPEINGKIDRHIAQATKLGIQGTPHVIINGSPVSGYQKDMITQLIQKAVK
ncbi:MAG: thioredoxin domain-containing protein [Geovibrio sp.]|jgi:protein-disulfide isomerase|nr:thioredoxin domain-containing protein [Geovibrio sp.]HAL86201.1 hypothetical protein [Deferribacteraceae bacterium]